MNLWKCYCQKNNLHLHKYCQTCIKRSHLGQRKSGL